MYGAASWNTRTSYDSIPVFQGPCCLIKNGIDGKLKTCPNVMRQLEQIKLPLNVVSITGPYRTGKSYLLNHLAGKRKGFPLGSTIEAKTKGIWVWCRPHPKRHDEILVLLDTEGLGDVTKGDDEHDNWIFALAVLLSSTLVYNCMSTIGQDALSRLHYVTELTKRIKTRDTRENEDGREFFKIFPNFVWVLRDFTLELEKEGQPITSDDYLSDALQLKEGKNRHNDDFNRPRRCIRQFFGEKKCFIFSMPVENPKNLKELERLSDWQLDSSFLREAEKFCSYIHTRSFPKTANGQPIKGRMFCNLMESYVNVIQSGEIPCVENAVKNMAERENDDALKISFNLYKTQMKKSLQKSTINDEKLSKIHLDCSRKALECFMSMSTLDENQKYQCQLLKKIRKKYKEICSENRKECGWDLTERGCVQQEEFNTHRPGGKTSRRRRLNEQRRLGKESSERIKILGTRDNTRENKQILVELENSNQHLCQLQKKIVQEKENIIKEKKRRLEQKKEERKRKIESERKRRHYAYDSPEEDILEEQSKELKREITNETNEIKEVKKGGSSLGNFLRRGKCVLLGTIKGAFAGAQLGALSGNPIVVAVTAVVGAVVGGIAGFFSALF